jgi:ATP-dependent protease ClpP protease subunit
VFDGIAIYNMVARHPAKITVTVDGLAASMVSLIARMGSKSVCPAIA